MFRIPHAPILLGDLAVDFFFFLSGYFLMEHYQKNIDCLCNTSSEIAAFHYAKKRYMRLFPHHTYSWIIMALVVIFIWQSQSCFEVIVNCFYEFFMLELSGLGIDNRINGVGWYCSALIICSYFTFYLIHKTSGSIYIFSCQSVLALPILFSQCKMAL